MWHYMGREMITYLVQVCVTYICIEGRGLFNYLYHRAETMIVSQANNIRDKYGILGLKGEKIVKYGNNVH